MNIFTSYFSNPIKLPEKDTMYLSIARYKPDWFEGPEYKDIAPPPELLSYYKRNLANNEMDIFRLQQQYMTYYIKHVLDNKNPSSVVKELTDMATKRGKKYIVLLCYERSDDFCHRHIVSMWLKGNGYECQELTSEVLKVLNEETL